MMGEVSSLTDLGLDLWILVYHLYGRYKNEPDQAFRELALRTRCICTLEDIPIAKSPSSLRGTKWYQKLTTRYAKLREHLKQSHQETLQEAKEMTRSLYAAGCRIKEYPDALQTCAAMLTISIPTHALLTFAQCRVKEFASRGCITVTADELIHDLIERPVLDAVTPPQWWVSDADADNIVSVKSVGLRARPAQIHILYTYSDKLRCCRIHLEGILHKTGPVATLAKRLAHAHGTLISEEKFRTYLLRLQGLLRDATEGEGIKHTSNNKIEEHRIQEQPVVSTAVAATTEAEAVGLGKRTKESQKPQSAVNKADVGLLYRDPEAALENVDLNDADDVTLREFKAKMEERFLENVLRPGDPGYEYDKRVEVKPTQHSEWDDSD